MKRVSFFLAIFIALTVGLNAQHVEIFDLGTIANSVDETVYLDLSAIQKANGWSKIDSVLNAIYAENETDIDSLTVYPGFRGTKGGSTKTVYGAALNYTVTVNINDAATVYEELLSSGATLLTSAALRQNNYIKYLTRGAASGNDPADPNRAWLICFVYGTK